MKRNIVIIGGGFGGVYTHKYLHKYLKSKDFRITLINNENYFLFTPLLHEVATGNIMPQSIIESLTDVLECCEGSILLGSATSVNTKEKTVAGEFGNIIYDYLVLAPGSTASFHDIEGGDKYSMTLKSIRDAISIKNKAIDIAYSAEKSGRRKISIVIVGGGATGVEIAGELSDYLLGTLARKMNRNFVPEIKIFLISRTKRLIKHFHYKISNIAEESLKKRGVIVLTDEVKKVNKTSILLKQNKELNFDMLVWAGGINANTIPINNKTYDRYEVDEYLRLAGTQGIYAIGDAAYHESFPKNPSAQLAVKQAKTAAYNIVAEINREKGNKFTYKKTGDLISLGKWKAAGEIHGFVFSGPFAWLIWRVNYLMNMISYRKKLRVAFDWLLRAFTDRDTTRI